MHDLLQQIVRLIQMKEIFPGIFRNGRGLFTQNLAAGKSVYGEKRLIEKDAEYREWIPERSKMAAAIMNGAKHVPERDSKILYLGASTGTTVSHFSDIVGSRGIIYALEFAERVFRSLMNLAQQRKNIAPLFVDARKPENYLWIELCDMIYVDIAQPDESAIALRNADIFLKKKGILFVAVKARSIDVTKDPKQIFKEEAAKIEKNGYKILQTVDLEPYEDSHAMIVAEKSD